MDEKTQALVDRARALGVTQGLLNDPEAIAVLAGLLVERRKKVLRHLARTTVPKR